MLSFIQITSYLFSLVVWSAYWIVIFKQLSQFIWPVLLLFFQYRNYFEVRCIFRSETTDVFYGGMVLKKDNHTWKKIETYVVIIIIIYIAQ